MILFSGAPSFTSFAVGLAQIALLSGLLEEESCNMSMIIPLSCTESSGEVIL